MSSFTIKSNQLNEIDFIVRAKNLSENTDVRFVIHETNHDITIHCKNIKEDTWSASIPPFNTKLKEANFHIEVVSDEYLFKPMSGTVTIMNAPIAPVVEVFEKKTPSISIEMASQKTLIENFKPLEKKNLIKTMSSTSKILETAANVFKSLTNDPDKITGKSLLSVIEASKHALENIEDNIWKK